MTLSISLMRIQAVLDRQAKMENIQFVCYRVFTKIRNVFLFITLELVGIKR